MRATPPAAPAPAPGPVNEPTKPTFGSPMKRVNKSKGGRWGAEEEAKLRDLIEERRPAGSKDWGQIGELLGGRSASATQQHWDIMRGLRDKSGRPTGVGRAAPAAAAATPAPPTVAPSTRIVRGTGDASAPLELASSDDEAARETPAPARIETSVGERRAKILRCFEHAVLCTGCGKPACAMMKNHFIHRHETAGQCRCTVCRGIEVCIVLHARRCRSPTCPIGACARRRLQDAQAVAAAPAPARLPPPAAAERATTSGSYAPSTGGQSHLFR